MAVQKLIENRHDQHYLSPMTMNIREAISKAIAEETANFKSGKRDNLNEADEMAPEAPESLSMHDGVVAITKAAASCIKAVEALKGKNFPTAKSANAVASAVEGLEALMQDMLRSPMDYLDIDADQLVKDHEAKLTAAMDEVSESSEDELSDDDKKKDLLLDDDTTKKIHDYVQKSGYKGLNGEPKLDNDKWKLPVEDKMGKKFILTVPSKSLE